MRRLVIVLLCFVFITATLSACSGEKNKATEAAATPDTSAGDELLSIKTDYCTLKYPNKWGDKFSTKIENTGVYTVEFLYGDTPVFALTFNGGEGSPLGTIIVEESHIVIRVDAYPHDQKDENYDIYRVMQEDINTMVDHLKKDYQFVTDIIEDASDEVFEIKTPVVSLFYPKKWEDKITVDTDENTVRFSYEQISLFDISFGGDNGEVIGSYKDIPVLLDEHIIDKDAVTDEQFKTMSAMKEDINVIIEYLRKDSEFVSG